MAVRIEPENCCTPEADWRCNQEGTIQLVWTGCHTEAVQDGQVIKKFYGRDGGIWEARDWLKEQKRGNKYC